MKNTLFLLFTILSFVYSEDQELLPAMTPDRDPKRFGLELDVFGLSYHSNRNYDFNEVNHGVGLSFTIGDDEVDEGYSAVMVASIGTYKDSYHQQAYFFIAGPRLTLGYRDSFHVTGALQIGYAAGSGLHGQAIIPLLSVGYDRLDLCFTGNPFQKDEADKSKFVACYLKIRVLDW